jgi:hypothetical protein
MIAPAVFRAGRLGAPFKSKSRLEAENAALRHQLIVLRRKVHGRVRLTNNDRWFFIQLYRWFPSILKVLTIIRPGLLSLLAMEIAPIGRAAADRDGPPCADPADEHREPAWGAPRIHGELLKLVFEIAQSSVA